MEPWNDKYVEKQKILINYIEQLQQENKELKDTILCYQLHTEVAPNSHESINGNELICNLFTENKSIKNILTEFEHWLEEQYNTSFDPWFPKILNKLQELKEGKK